MRFQNPVTARSFIIHGIEGFEKPQVIPATGDNLEKLLSDLGIPPDFRYTSDRLADIKYIHRISTDGDIYFISNQENRAVSIIASCRQPECGTVCFWDPSTGNMTGLEPEFHNGRSKVNLKLDSYGSGFIVFSDISLDLDPVFEKVKTIPVNGPWELRFPPASGAPEEPIIINTLTDWTDFDQFGIRHFSGTVSYSATIHCDDLAIDSGKHVLIDLGEVREMAQDMVNGEEAAMLWKPPFRSEITRLLVPGDNHLKIKVTNLWVNRMIGDEYFPDEMGWYKTKGAMLPVEWPDWLVHGKSRPETSRVTWTTRGKIYSKDDPLLPSGLLGPVKLIISRPAYPD